MTLIDVLTIAACLVAGAFTIRLGNRALREQRIEKKRRQRRKKAMTVETKGQDLDAVLRDLDTALRNLAIWRERGYLRATEASWEELLRLATNDPEIALELQRIVEHHIERTEGQTREGKPVKPVWILLADEETEELTGDFESKRESQDKLMVQTPLLTN